MSQAGPEDCGDTSRVVGRRSTRSRKRVKYQVEAIDEIIQVLQAMQRQVPVVQTAQKTVEIPQRQFMGGPAIQVVAEHREGDLHCTQLLRR